MNIGERPPVTYGQAKGGERPWSDQTMRSAKARSPTSIIERIVNVAVTVWPSSLRRARRATWRAWGRVRWKLVAIIILTLSSTVLVASLAIATLNVVMRRESTNIVEKQIQTLVQASRRIAPAVLERAGTCVVPRLDSSVLKPLLSYSQAAFPEATISVAVEDNNGSQSPTPHEDSADVIRPDWVPDNDFAGVVVDQGKLEVRNVAAIEKDACKVTAIFRMPLGSELAKRLSSQGSSDVITVSPTRFHVGGLSHKILGMIEDNFLPGTPRPAAVVLNVRNWETGARENWTAYELRTSYARTFSDLATVGSQLANWVWLLTAISLTALVIDLAAIRMCVRLSRNIAMAIDDLSCAAQQLSGGNFAWRTPVRSNDQLGELIHNFNEMAVSLERLKREEVLKLQFESELRVAQRVQEYLFPRLAPVVPGATVAGHTLPARPVGGDLYDFFDLDHGQLGLLCADVSGKGVPAALMMANLQAVARAHVGMTSDSSAAHAAQFVEKLNEEFVGRFGDNRYATLFWAEYDAQARLLRYVNAGHPPPILVHSTGEIVRLEPDGLPIGMFRNARYATSQLQMKAGSRLILFTDGITDAQTSSGEEFGDTGVIDCCRSIPGELDAEGVVERLMQAAAEWSVDAEQFDDTTVVVVAVRR
jgi:serine phosphatase RsbU (regulator of sigma subunit)